MRLFAAQLVVALAAVLCATQAYGQNATVPETANSNAEVAPPSSQQVEPLLSAASATPAVLPATQAGSDSAAVQILQSFKDSDIKFNLADLMDTLRDKRHEGWVLAAYPDPKTGHPLIGAGFTLDLPERSHAQPDVLNSHAFLEPSSADLWRAAGLAPDRLDGILDQYSTRFAAWHKKGFQRRIPTLTPQITDDEATLLLRISAIQAVYNARAYCRNFDRMTGPQQMALSQLVYQIGLNLVRFDDFLSLINDGVPAAALAADAPVEALGSDRDYWHTVQHTLMQTQWARLYRTRAIAVIAMLDPAYDDSPTAAEHLISATLRPVAHRRHAASINRVASKSGGSRSGSHKRKARARAKRRA